MVPKWKVEFDGAGGGKLLKVLDVRLGLVGKLLVEVQKLLLTKHLKLSLGLCCLLCW